MKKVIFICLLSLSLCFSDTNPQEGAKPQQQATNASIDPKTAQEKSAVQPSLVTQNNTVSTPNSTAQTTPNQEEKANATNTNATAPEKKENATESKVTPENKDKIVEPSKDKNETKTGGNTETKAAGAGSTENKTAGGATAANGTSTDDKDKKKNDTITTTTEKIDTSKTTEPPKATTDKPIVQSRAFDGPSFIGGIILTLGLLAIGFMGFRYHKNQTERNYHTL